MIITSTELDMDILGIDTDNETKGIHVSNPLNENKADDIKSPKLSVVDSIGVELLSNKDDTKKEIIPILIRRLILPFFIPVISLICCFLLIKNNKI